MHIVSTSSNRGRFTKHAIKTLDDVNTLLIDEDFLSEYGFMFEDGITGFRFGERTNRREPIELVIQYWDGNDYEETTFYLNEVFTYTNFNY